MNPLKVFYQFCFVTLQLLLFLFGDGFLFVCLADCPPHSNYLYETELSSLVTINHFFISEREYFQKHSSLNLKKIRMVRG